MKGQQLKLGTFGYETGAQFSRCLTYRYSLWRVWEPDLPKFAVIGLNPSTADETDNDPTVTRCINFAKREKCGGLFMLNLFAYRATDPRVMRSVGEPIGPENDSTIDEFVGMSGVVVAAWGNHGQHMGRSREFLDQCGVVDQLMCFGQTNSGEPLHPLYLANDRPLVPFVRRA